MMEQFILTVDGTPYSIEIKGNQVIVNGYVLTSSLETDAIQINGMAHTVELAGSQAVVDGIAYSFGVEWPTDHQESPASKRAKPAEEAAGQGVVKAIMPGKIVRVVVKEGDEVKEGQVVAILEAMKMENELSAPVSGQVKQVLVKAGATVEQNQTIVVVGS
jgi:biotin carboxyl carrier protein